MINFCIVFFSILARFGEPSWSHVGNFFGQKRAGLTDLWGFFVGSFSKFVNGFCTILSFRPPSFHLPSTSSTTQHPALKKQKKNDHRVALLATLSDTRFSAWLVFFVFVVFFFVSLLSWFSFSSSCRGELERLVSTVCPSWCPSFWHRFFDSFLDKVLIVFPFQLGTKIPLKSFKNRCQDAFCELDLFR